MRCGQARVVPGAGRQPQGPRGEGRVEERRPARHGRGGGHGGRERPGEAGRARQHVRADRVPVPRQALHQPPDPVRRPRLHVRQALRWQHARRVSQGRGERREGHLHAGPEPPGPRAPPQHGRRVREHGRGALGPPPVRELPAGGPRTAQAGRRGQRSGLEDLVAALGGEQQRRPQPRRPGLGRPHQRCTRQVGRHRIPGAAGTSGQAGGLGEQEAVTFAEGRDDLLGGHGDARAGGAGVVGGDDGHLGTERAARCGRRRQQRRRAHTPVVQDGHRPVRPDGPAHGVLEPFAQITRIGHAGVARGVRPEAAGRSGRRAVRPGRGRVHPECQRRPRQVQRDRVHVDPPREPTGPLTSGRPAPGHAVAPHAVAPRSSAPRSHSSTALAVATSNVSRHRERQSGRSSPRSTARTGSTRASRQ